MADRYCRKCGHELRQDDRFCPSCGRSVLQTAVVPTPEADTSVSPPPTALQPAQQEQQTEGSGSRGSQAGACAGCIIILLIIALVIALWLGRGGAAGWIFIGLLITAFVGWGITALADNADRRPSVPASARELRAMPYREYLQTPHWKRRREEKLLSVGRRCQVCNRGSVSLDVHHRTYERLGEELDEDLTVLCRDCHSTFHEYRRLGR